MGRILFLGTGTSTGVPQIGCRCEVCRSTDVHDHRLRTSALLEAGGCRLLMDCGPDFRQQMLAHGITWLSAVLLTHEHYDHVGGMDDLRPFGDMHVYAEGRVLEAVRRVMPYCFAPRPYPGVPCIELHEVRPYEPFDVRGLQVMPVRLMHACLPILGYRIGNVAYLTDAKTVDERAIEQLGGLDVLVLNALRKKEHMSHLSLDESLALARRIGAKKTFLIHMSHEIGLHDTVQRTLPDGVVLAYDGLEAEVDG